MTDFESFWILASHGLTEDQTAIQTLARQFADKEMAPFMLDWDEREHFPAETLRKSAELGFGGLYCKEEFGGMNLSRLETSVCIFDDEFPLICILLYAVSPRLLSLSSLILFST